MKRSVLFVCLGNICRSPLAEGVFRAITQERGRGDEYYVDSAGTGGWHVGSLPDPRSIDVARRYGIDLTQQRCRKITPQDFERFDLILAMDHANWQNLSSAAPPDATNVHLFLEYAEGRVEEIPDPYYGGPDGFENVYRTIRDASESLLEKLSEPSGS